MKEEEICFSRINFHTVNSSPLPVFWSRFLREIETMVFSATCKATGETCVKKISEEMSRHFIVEIACFLLTVPVKV